MPTQRRRPAVPARSAAEAPGALGVVEALVNTGELTRGRIVEHVQDTAALTAWLRDHGLLLPSERIADDRELRRWRRVREALRDLLHANHHDQPPPAAALDVLDREARRLALHLRFGRDGADLVPAGGGSDGALAALLTVVFDAMRDGSWTRLKACDNAACRWAFYDASRNRSGRWCDMAVCGNRAKVHNYRRRRNDG